MHAENVLNGLSQYLNMKIYNIEFSGMEVVVTLPHNFDICEVEEIVKLLKDGMRKNKFNKILIKSNEVK